EKMPPDARVNYERWVGMGEVRNIPPRGSFDVIVDAVFGIGLSRPIAADLVSAVDATLEASLLASPNSKTKIVAVDTVSGVCADSGRDLGHPVPYFAHLTVTFHRPKLGHYLGDHINTERSLRCVDIGLGDTKPAVQLTRMPGRRLGKHLQHKYSHGHALILSGPSGRGGAARLAARGALRIGAGVVTVGCPHEAVPENAARLDAVMLRAVHNKAELRKVLEDTRINALCLGPGMEVARAKAMLGVALAVVRDEHAPYPRRPGVVLDADALTALAEVPELFAMLHDGCVLTPHAGEFARLFPDIAARLAEPATRGPAYSKVDATREAAARAGCLVLFKGADTVIAAPDGRCSINSAHYDRAAPWLATAGSGDVLAGFITGLLARGFAPMQAAETAAWLHVECARSFGPGLIAEDLPEELPKVFRALGL
ncbi:MAG: NAD(P)H-hydrate dehydratase, partial [Paracoccaceae bacterium]